MGKFVVYCVSWYQEERHQWTPGWFQIVDHNRCSTSLGSSQNSQPWCAPNLLINNKRLNHKLSPSKVEWPILWILRNRYHKSIKVQEVAVIGQCLHPGDIQSFNVSTSTGSPRIHRCFWLVQVIKSPFLPKLARKSPSHHSSPILVRIYFIRTCLKCVGQWWCMGVLNLDHCLWLICHFAFVENCDSLKWFFPFILCPSENK